MTPRIVCGRLDAQQVQDRGHHVDDVRVLGADLAAGRDPPRPGDDERIAGAAPVGLPLPPAERRVPGKGPAPRVVVEVPGAADLIDQRQAFLQRLLGVVEELRLIRGPGRAALGAGAVVGDDHDQGVVQLPERAQELHQPPDLVIGVGQETGEHLHHPGSEPPGGRGQRRPVGHVRIVPRQLRVGRDDAEFLLPGEHLLPVGVPALVELARVPVRPFLRHVVRRVRGAEAQMQVERLGRVDLLDVGDELHRLVDQVLAEVVPLLGRARRLHLVVVIHQVRIPLAGIPAQEAVVALEAAPQRPPVIGARGRLLVARRQVVLPDHERAVAVLEEHLGQEAVLERDHAVVPGIAARQLRDAGHRVAVMVAAGQDARPARRAQRGRVHVVVAQAVRGERVEAGRRDRAAVTAQLPEPGVIQHDEQHVRRALAGPHRGRPGRRGLIRGPPDHARERSTRLILDYRHPDPSDAHNGTPMVNLYGGVPIAAALHPQRVKASGGQVAAPRLRPHMLGDGDAEGQRVMVSPWSCMARPRRVFPALPGSLVHRSLQD